MSYRFDTNKDVQYVQDAFQQPTAAAEVEAMHYHEVAGDFTSGHSFSDEVARALEARSETGWHTSWVQFRNYTEIRIDKMHDGCAECARNKATADQADREQGVLD